MAEPASNGRDERPLSAAAGTNPTTAPDSDPSEHDDPNTRNLPANALLNAAANSHTPRLEGENSGTGEWQLESDDSYAAGGNTTDTDDSAAATGGAAAGGGGGGFSDTDEELTDEDELDDDHPLEINLTYNDEVLPWSFGSSSGAALALTGPGSQSGLDADREPPAEYVLKLLFSEFVSQANRKVEQLLLEPLERSVGKSLQHGEDAVFDQLLSALHALAEHCLASIMRALFAWYRAQTGGEDASRGHSAHFLQSHLPPGCSLKPLLQKRDLAVHFVLCLALLEVCRQLQVHPVEEDLLVQVEDIAFQYFKPKLTPAPSAGLRSGTGPAASSQTTGSQNAASVIIVADLFAQLIGELAKTRFQHISSKFKAEFRELKRSEEPGPWRTQAFVSLIMGLKFLRVKMCPIQEFEMCFQFMHDLAGYLGDPVLCKEKEIRHALAGLLVEILLPVAAVARNEVNIPLVKTLVEKLYEPTRVASEKKKHSLALFPLVTCLLCVSQNKFFLANWGTFLNSCLSQLRNRDAKMARVALESLYRLLWVYMVRIKGENNVATNAKLNNIIQVLFPKNSRHLNPRHMPLNIFVKIIHFIAQEKLDLAMREIVFDLLHANSKPNSKTFQVAPERMNVGLRAFLVIADNLQKMDGPPPMPTNVTNLPSGNPIRVKKNFLNKTLDAATALNHGLGSYHATVSRALGTILRTLHATIGKPMLRHVAHALPTKDQQSLTLTREEKKPKLDLFRTCVAAIPRLLPENMRRHELLDMLCALVDHTEEEMRMLSVAALQSIVVDMPEWRCDLLARLVLFIARDVPDTMPVVLDSLVRVLLQLLVRWRDHLNPNNSSSTPPDPPKSKCSSLTDGESGAHVGALRRVEGLALCLLCHLRVPLRRLALLLLQTCRGLAVDLGVGGPGFMSCVERMDAAVPDVLQALIPQLPPGPDKTAAVLAVGPDMQWLVERSSPTWADNSGNDCANIAFESPTKEDLASRSQPVIGGFDAWSEALVRLLDQSLMRGGSGGGCINAVEHAWQCVATRINLLFNQIDQSNPQEVTRATLSRTPKRPSAINDFYLKLWRNYLIFACSAWSRGADPRASPLPGVSSSGVGGGVTLVGATGSSNEEITGPVAVVAEPRPRETINKLYHNIIPLMRGENVDIRESVVTGLGYTNAQALRDTLDELALLLKEYTDRKPENKRRARKRAESRLMLIRIFASIARRGVILNCLGDIISSNQQQQQQQAGPQAVVAKDKWSLRAFLADLLESYKACLEPNPSDGSDSDNIHQHIKLHFSQFVQSILQSIDTAGNTWRIITSDMQQSLFYLLSNWSGALGAIVNGHQPPAAEGEYSPLEMAALSAMSAVLVCDSVYDKTCLFEDSYIYTWLDAMLSNPQVYTLGADTLRRLLVHNSASPDLLHWLVALCYSGAPPKSHACFVALATVYTQLSVPATVDVVGFLSLSLYFADCCDLRVREMALQLLQVLERRVLSPLDQLVHPDSPDQPDRLPRPTAESQSLLAQDTFVEEPMCAHYKTQRHLAKELSKARPELTLGMFSEMTMRLEGAGFSGQQTLLRCLQPWMENIELVEPSLAAPQIGSSGGVSPRLLCPDPATHLTPLSWGQGWGSTAATDLVLNNLFFITVQYMHEHAVEIEKLWQTLCNAFHDNAAFVLRFFTQLCSIAGGGGAPPGSVLAAVKLAVVATAKGNRDHVMNFLLAELSAIDALPSTVRPEDSPPYFRFHSGSGSGQGRKPSQPPPAEGATAANAGSVRSNTGTMRSTCSSSSNTTIANPPADQASARHSSPQHIASVFASPPPTAAGDSVNQWLVRWRRHFLANNEQPRPLPLPPGPHWAPLAPLVLTAEPSQSQQPPPPPPHFAVQRCFASLVLQTELILTDFGFDWSPHIPLLFHTALLGLDHGLSLVSSHARRVLVNFAITQLPPLDLGQMSCLLVSAAAAGSAHPVRPCPPLSYRADESCDEDWMDMEMMRSSEDPACALIQLLLNNIERALWSGDDVCPRSPVSQSGRRVERFTDTLAGVFEQPLGGRLFRVEWAELALKMALSSSSRHYASRSFQVYRGLGVTPGSRHVSDLVIRLGDTVGDTAEDNQGYVIEVLHTLMDMVTRLSHHITSEAAEPPGDSGAAAERTADGGGGGPHATSTVKRGKAERRHRRPAVLEIMSRRTCSYNGPALERMKGSCKITPSSATCDSRDLRLLKARSECLPRNFGLGGVRRPYGGGIFDDHLTMLSQVFWTVVGLLESDFEYEFLLALSLLDKLLDVVELKSVQQQSVLYSVYRQMRWASFSGLQPLVLKGLTCPPALSATLRLMARLTPYTSISAVDDPQRGLPLNIVALLPWLLHNFDEPQTELLTVAEQIALECLRLGEVGRDPTGALDNLAAVMRVYSRQTYSKDHCSWLNAVCKYIAEAAPNQIMPLVTFLVQLLERGPVSYQTSLLNIINSLVGCLDLQSVNKPLFNRTTVHILAKFLQFPSNTQWRDSLKTLKQVVTRSSTLSSPKAGQRIQRLASPVVEEAIIIKKELPGRTLSFTYDLPIPPIGGSSSTPTAPQPSSVSQSSAAPPVALHQHTHSMTPSIVRHLGTSSPSPSLEAPIASSARRKSTPELASAPPPQPLAPPGGVSQSTSADQMSLMASEDTVSSTESSTLHQSSDNASLFLTRQTSIATTGANPDNSFNWKKPANSQRRVREKLSGVIRSFGPTVINLARTPSVVFSSTNEVDPPPPPGSATLLDKTISGGASVAMTGSVAGTTVAGYSSGDENGGGSVMMMEPSQTDSFKRDDTSSTDMHVFSHFDFLDTELDSELDDPNKFHFGVRRPSNTSAEDQAGVGGVGGAHPDDDLGIEFLPASRSGDTRGANDHKCATAPSEKPSGGGACTAPGEDSSDEEDEEDDDDEDDDTQETAPLSPPLFQPVAPPVQFQFSTPSTTGGSVFVGGVPQGLDLGLLTLDETVTDATLVERVDDLLLTASDVTQAPQADDDLAPLPAFFFLFYRLAHWMRGTLGRLLADCDHIILSRQLQPVKQQLSEAFSALRARCLAPDSLPLILLNWEALSCLGLSSPVTSVLMELVEHHENYSSTLLKARASVNELRGRVNSSSLLANGGSGSSRWAADEKRICHTLARLHFQVTMMLSCFQKLTAAVQSGIRAHNQAGVLDVSLRVAALVREWSESSGNPSVPLVGSRATGASRVRDALTENKFALAVALLRKCRDQFPVDQSANQDEGQWMFGRDGDDELLFLLAYLYNSALESHYHETDDAAAGDERGRPAVVAVWSPDSWPANLDRATSTNVALRTALQACSNPLSSNNHNQDSGGGGGGHVISYL